MLKFSIVIRLRAGHPREIGSNPSRDKRFNRISSPKRSYRVWDPHSHLFNGSSDFSVVVKCLKRVIIPPPPLPFAILEYTGKICLYITTIFQLKG
jgi:hypothetical protein